MLDIGWRGLLVALVVVVDLMVFADLAREEIRGWRAGRARRAARGPRALAGDRAHAMAGRAP